MKKYFIKAVSGLIIFLSVIFIMQSCKKDKATPDNTPKDKYFLSATVNGTAWKSDTTVAGDYQDQIIVLAIKVVNSDTSAFVFEFSDMLSINQPTAFNETHNNILVYAFQPVNNPGISTNYLTDPSVGGSGTFTITKFDKTAKMIEGTFSGTGINSTNSNDKVTITNGKFSMPYIIGRPPDVNI